VENEKDTYSLLMGGEVAAMVLPIPLVRFVAPYPLCWREEEDIPICTHLTSIAHLVPYSPLPFFTFETFGYALVIFKYLQTQIRPQYQMNERRSTSRMTGPKRSDHPPLKLKLLRVSPLRPFLPHRKRLPQARGPSQYAGFGYEINPLINKSALVCLNHSPRLANFFINAAPLKFPGFRANVTVLTAISGTPLSR
jgi:hypothetical protein